jgi:hypothetical protein
MTVLLKKPGSKLIYTFDWSEDVPVGASVDHVDYTSQSNITFANAALDVASSLSSVEVIGGVHSDVAVIQADCTMTNGEVIPAQFTLRIAQT